MSKEDVIAAWRKWRAEQTDETLTNIANGSILQRKAIYTACGISRSALGQNETVAAELDSLEKELRKKGILSPLKEKPFALKQESFEPKTAANQRPKAETTEDDRLAKKDAAIKRLEERNVVLQNEMADVVAEKNGYLKEIADLKGEVASLTRQLDAREEHLLETGRQAR